MRLAPKYKYESAPKEAMLRDDQDLEDEISSL